MSDPDDQPVPPPRSFRLLSALALAPFVALALWLAGIADDHPWRGTTIDLLKTYAALMLCFAGGSRWGIAVQAASAHGEKTGPYDLPAGVLALFIGLALFFVPTPYAFALFAVAFAAQGAWDAFAAHESRAPAWFARARLVATILIVGAMVVALLATA
ncbi:DUF3429 family protein [Nitratireductor sp. CAU 1489]|uniref:DUF3429 family protein n=1 Tax=Nitratireductor arenosus TaxID=2682096 RepID=A0A844QKS0_9HYPH|nr:DUF3429 domain-containing protein [Nitratireductor arenosus]MVA98491.1 DUF3429 family protein [Nitratireductor arenosus]